MRSEDFTENISGILHSNGILIRDFLLIYVHVYPRLYSNQRHASIHVECSYYSKTDSEVKNNLSMPIITIS